MARLLELQLCHIQLKLAQMWLPHRTHVNGRRPVLEQGNLNQSEKVDQQLLIKTTLTITLEPPWCSETSILHRRPCEKASEELLLPPTCEIYPELLLDHWICLMQLLTIWTHWYAVCKDLCLWHSTRTRICYHWCPCKNAIKLMDCICKHRV